MKIAKYKDGYVVNGVWPGFEIIKRIKDIGKVPLIIADPPYGNIVKQYWDRFESADELAELQCNQAKSFQDLCDPGAAMYWFGGYGKPGFRPFYKFIDLLERNTKWRMSMHVTWSKRRAYGVQHNYLSTREEIAYCILGDIKKPAVFNVPYLDEERGYEGFNKKYKAKSKFKRRTAVWTDITEIFRGKLHECHKPGALLSVPITTHTTDGDWVVDPFGGSGETAVQCRRLNRMFFLVERDKDTWDKIIKRLGTPVEIITVDESPC